MIRQALFRVILHEHQLRTADQLIAGLLHSHADLDDLFLGVKGQNGITADGNLGSIGDIGPSMDVAAAGAAVAVYAAPVGVGNQQMAVFVGLGVGFFALIPNLDAIGPQLVGIIAVQPRRPDHGLQIHRLLKFADNMLVAGPIPGGPMGVEIAVGEEIGFKRRLCGVFAGGVVVGVRQPDCDLAGIQQSFCGQALQRVIFHRLGRAFRNAGRAAFADFVAGDDIDGICDFIFQALNGDAGFRQVAAYLLIIARGVLFFEKDLVVSCRFGFFPGDGQLALQLLNAHHIRRVRRFVGLRRGLNRFAVIALPVGGGGNHLEAIGFQIFQAGDVGIRNVYIQFFGHFLGFVLNLLPIQDPIAGNVGQLAPFQAHRFAAGFGFQISHHPVGGYRVFRHDIFQKLDGFHRHIACGGLFHRNGDFFHRNPLAQVDDDGTGIFPSAADGMNICRLFNADHFGFHSFFFSVFLINHCGGNTLNIISCTGRVDDDLLHIFGLVQRDGQFDATVV